MPAIRKPVTISTSENLIRDKKRFPYASLLLSIPVSFRAKNSLDHIIVNKLLPNVDLYFKIAAFLPNQFGKALKSDAHLSEEIVKRMKHQLHVENTLANEAAS